MRRDIAKLLENCQEATARIRVEHIIREENMMAAQEIIELFCELIVVRLPIIEIQSYDPSKWRPSIPFSEQLRAFQYLIDEGKVRYIGVSNETSYGVMEFVHTAKVEGLPKIVSIQNSYSLLVRCKFEIDLVEVCHPNHCNIVLLAYSPLGGGTLSGKYMDVNTKAAKKGRKLPSNISNWLKSMD